jgi:fatty acid desaturase
VTAPPDAQLDVPAAHAIVADLFRPRLAVYWVDLLVSLGVGAASFAVAPTVAPFPWGALFLLISVLALYRAAAFIHEIVHQRRRPAFREFRIVWNLLVGMPLLVPSFLYENHLEHHGRHDYGTRSDGEYVPFARRPPSAILWFLLATPVVPLLTISRFGILAPLSWPWPRLRGAVYRRASSLRIDIDYTWHEPGTPAQRRRWIVQESACFALVWAVAGLVGAGVVPVERVGQWYLTVLGIVLLNSFRLLGAHRYESDEAEMTFAEQLQDSVNYPRRRLLAELWAPVGLRLHALHHLFPALPYHALDQAHARLMRQLPEGSPYRMTGSPGLRASLQLLWRRAREQQRAEAVLAERRVA